MTTGPFGINYIALAGLASAAPDARPDARSDAINRAVVRLREAGHSVRPADGVPGLWEVSGYPELTTGQLLDVAGKL